MPFQLTSHGGPEDGATTDWSFAVVDACGLSSLVPIPIREAFPNGFTDENGGSNDAHPPGASRPYWDYTDWDTMYTFVDHIGQCCGSQNPSVTFTGAAPPYTYNTVYLDGTHTFNAGSMSSGDGWLVYTGKIRYFRDHGGNNP